MSFPTNLATFSTKLCYNLSFFQQTLLQYYQVMFRKEIEKAEIDYNITNILKA